MGRHSDFYRYYESTMKKVGYIPRDQASTSTYKGLGFRCGLEIHQQLKTKQKLFCRCPAGLYQKQGEYDAEVVRHMRPTLSELGEYDGTALMEFRTRKNIFYHIKYETACTYDIDDTPPFPLNREALFYAIQIALMLKTKIVGELHIIRKQYLDGSIPTGFQRTAIVGIDGTIPVGDKTVRIIQISLEEDACREVSDIGHNRVYTTDRLGMPLIEMVTAPELLTPDEAEEAGQYLRFLSRSSGKVRTGIGAARQDVNVSIQGGTRIEIKGVAHLKWIPELTHNEAFRQKSLLTIRELLHKKGIRSDTWRPNSQTIASGSLRSPKISALLNKAPHLKLVAVNLPKFKGILSHFTQPGHCFADEISDRLHVIACVQKPNMTHSEELEPFLLNEDLTYIRQALGSKPEDAQLLFWAPEEDVQTALETIEERCLLAFNGVPNETRKALPDGTTVFERVLPGPDRMYPDTDSAPISITEDMLDRARQSLPMDVSEQKRKLIEWQVPAHFHLFILRKHLFPLLAKIVDDFSVEPRFVARVLCQKVQKHVERQQRDSTLPLERIYQLFGFVKKEQLDIQIVEEMIPLVLDFPDMNFQSVLEKIGFQRVSREQILEQADVLIRKFGDVGKRKDSGAAARWVMGELRKKALGNISLSELKAEVERGIHG